MANKNFISHKKYIWFIMIFQFSLGPLPQPEYALFFSASRAMYYNACYAAPSLIENLEYVSVVSLRMYDRVIVHVFAYSWLLRLLLRSWRGLTWQRVISQTSWTLMMRMRKKRCVCIIMWCHVISSCVSTVVWSMEGVWIEKESNEQEKKEKRKLWLYIMRNTVDILYRSPNKCSPLLP